MIVGLEVKILTPDVIFVIPDDKDEIDGLLGFEDIIFVEY
jgi:hypothetical protein